MKCTRSKRLVGAVTLAAWAGHRSIATSAALATPLSRACAVYPQHPAAPSRQRVFGDARGRKNITTCGAGATFAAAGAKFCSRTFLLVLFIIVDTGQALVMDWAENRSWKETRNGQQYARQTALVAESGLSVVTGLTLTVLLGGADVLATSFWPLFLRFLPIAVCFAVGLSLKMMAVNHFQAGTIKIVGQLRLAFVALASTIILARTYSNKQWLAIAAVTFFCVCFVQQKGQGRSQRGKPWKWNGLSQLFGWVCMNVIGGVLAEKTYKGSVGPYYVQKVAQDLGHLLTSTVMLFMVVPRFNPDEEIRSGDPEVSLTPGTSARWRWWAFCLWTPGYPTFC